MFWRRAEIPGTVTQTGGGRVWRAVMGSGVVVGISFFVASVIQSPSKRNLEALAGLIFVGFMLTARPFGAYLFTLALIPFPAQTSVASTSMLLIVAMAVLVAARSRQERLEFPFVSRDQDLAIMGWAIFVFLSFYNQHPEWYAHATWLALGFTTAVILYYATISLLNSEERLMQALKISQYIATALAVMGIFQWLFPERHILPEFFSFSRTVAESGEEIRRGEIRVTATFYGQELFAEYMGLSVMLQYFMFRWARTIFSKSFWLISLLLLVVALFATVTRGAIIIVATGFLYLIAMGRSVVPFAQSGRVIFVAIAVFYLSLGLMEPLVSHMMDRMATIGLNDGSVQHRTAVLQVAFKEVIDQPFIGHGIFIPNGTFKTAVSANIHNLYLTLAYTLGVPGLLFFGWMLVGLWRKGRSIYTDASLPLRTREIALALHIMLVMFMVDEIKIEYTRQPLYMHLVWAHFGFIMASWNLARKNKSAFKVLSRDSE
jgi:O-antigen ligase